MKPLYQKTEAIKNLKAKKNKKEPKSFLRSIQHLSKFIKNLSKKTDNMKRLLKKDIAWDWSTEIQSDFERLKQDITITPC